jgi:hypothetical protein
VAAAAGSLLTFAVPAVLRGTAGIGAAEILLAWRWQRSGKIVTGSRDRRL